MRNRMESSGSRLWASSATRAHTGRTQDQMDTAATLFQPSAALGRYGRGAIAQLRVVAEQAGLRL